MRVQNSTIESFHASIMALCWRCNSADIKARDVDVIWFVVESHALSQGFFMLKSPYR